MAIIDTPEYAKAYKVWCNYAHDDPGKRLMNYLDYLGVHHYQAHWDGFLMPEDTARKLRMLLSPHATTIIRMYYARRYSSDGGK